MTPDQLTIFYDVIGYVGMGFVICSFLMRKITWLRVLNIIGGLLSCVYGFLTKTYPTAILNLTLILVNLGMLLRWILTQRKIARIPEDINTEEEGRK